MTPRARGWIEPAQKRIRTTELERAAALEDFRLEPDRLAGLIRQHVVAQKRRSHRHASQRRGRGADFSDGDELTRELPVGGALIVRHYFTRAANRESRARHA